MNFRARLQRVEDKVNPPPMSKLPTNPYTGFAHFLRTAFACRKEGRRLPVDLHVPPAAQMLTEAVRKMRARSRPGADLV